MARGQRVAFVGAGRRRIWPHGRNKEKVEGSKFKVKGIKPLTFGTLSERLRSMIERYTRPEMGRIWSEENGFQKWLEVEILAAEGLAQRGQVPKAAVARIKKRARFNVAHIRKIEREVKHEIIAFLTCVAESIGDDARFLHVGMTSSDVMDT